MNTPKAHAPLLNDALKILLVDKRGTHPQVSLVDGVEYLSVLWATVRFDGVPGFDRKEGWYFDAPDEDRGLVAVHVDATGEFHVTNPEAEFAYLTGKIKAATELQTVLATLDSIKKADVKGLAIAAQPLAGWLE